MRAWSIVREISQLVRLQIHSEDCVDDHVGVRPHAKGGVRLDGHSEAAVCGSDFRSLLAAELRLYAVLAILLSEAGS